MSQDQTEKPSTQYEKPNGEEHAQLSLLVSRSLNLEQPLLTTKLRIPTQRHALLSRQRLTSMLADVGTAPLTVICASAGAGKTTLLSEWASNCEYQAAWLSLDDSDNNYFRFWEYFVGAIQAINQDFGNDSLAILRSTILDKENLFLTALLNEIDSLANPIVVILDDYHSIESEAIHNALTYFCEYIPEQMHLVIASRIQPPLRQARLRARGQLIEINQVEMNFTTGEVEEYFHHIEQMSLSERDIAWLHGKTEGWIAGIKLAALSLKKQVNPSEFIHSLTGSHHYISDYLTLEVLRQQPTSIQDFLLKTSILDRFCASLCNALTKTDDSTGTKHMDSVQASQSILEYLEKSNIFIQALDEERQWYRYHHLFAQLLRENLHKIYPDKITELYQRAGAWYEENGFCSEAVQMALAIKDYEHAADLIECNCQQMAMRSEMNTLSNWIDVLPVEMIRARPKLCLAKAWALIPSNRLLEAKTWLQYAENVDIETASSVSCESDKQRIMAEAATIHAMMALLQYDLPKIISYSQQALDTLQEDQVFYRGLVNLSLGVAYILSGDIEAANRSLTDAVYLQQTSGDILLAYLARYYLAKIANRKGRLLEAFKYLSDGLKITKTKNGVELPIACLAHIMLAGIHYEWNDLDTSLYHVETGLELSQNWWVRDAVIEGYFTLARIRKAQGHLSEALEAAQKSSQLAEQKHARPFITHEAISNLQSWLPFGGLDTAMTWAKNFEESLQVNSVLDFEMLAEAPAAAHLLVAEGHLEQAQRLLDPLLSSVQKRGLYRQVIEIYVLKTLIFSAQKKSSQALLMLEKALDLAEQEGYVRMFIDEGPPMLELLTQAQKHGIAPGYTEKLLTVFDDVPLGTLPLVEPLSERELEVLSLLADGSSPKQIAQELVISIGTVRSHLHNIYSKLQVRNQLQAVQRANELRLIR